MPALIAPAVRLHAACGGVLDEVRDTDLGPMRRYWVGEA
jgi:hypothetical protein